MPDSAAPALFPAPPALADRVRREAEAAADEIAAFTGDLVRIPTVNPPGRHYRECADLLGDRLRRAGFAVETFETPAADLPGFRWPADCPRRNVLGRLAGEAGDGGGRRVHLNGHLDVVPAGAGWSFDPFSGEVRNGAVLGRGTSDMKGGLAAAVFAVETLRRAGARLQGTVEISGTVDEETGGQAGVAWLAETGRIPKNTDAVFIPEPFGSRRVSVGHRGVYWFRVVSEGETAHGSMPFLGQNAALHLAPLLEAIRSEWKPALGRRRTALPVVPEGARAATVNVNGLRGGQTGAEAPSPQVPDRAEVVVDRRFLPEEGLAAVRGETARWVAACAAEDPARRYRIEEILTVEPVVTPPESLARAAIRFAVREALGTEVEEVASPGTYDQKHFAGVAGIRDCVAYGPGVLELAHRPDELCPVRELVDATAVLALAVAAVAGVEGPGGSSRPNRRASTE